MPLIRSPKMTTFKAILGMLAVLIVASQTFRHVYVCWIEPRESSLDQFEPATRDIAAAKSLEELLVLYRPALEEVRKADAKNGKDADSERSYRMRMEEPYKSEEQLRNAIREWETHRRQLAELHFFWWAGLVSVSLGALSYSRSKQWLGMSLLLLGFLEMIWATCPSFQTFGYPLEFERLLTFKVIYSMVSLILVFVGWRMTESQTKHQVAPAQ